MTVNELKLKDFRNFEKIDIKLDKKINLFYGKNAQGKTNLTEALCIAATGRTWRASSNKEVIRFTKDEAYIKAAVNNGNIKDIIEVFIKKGEKRNILINKIKAEKLGDLYGKLYMVVFTPEDLGIIKNGPAERRKFSDVELCQLNKIYYYNLKKYYHVLKQRNSLLKQPNAAQTLNIWDEQLISSGNEVITLRREFITDLKEKARVLYKEISENKEELDIIYKPSVTEYAFAEKLKKASDKDIIIGATSIGPHKDDIVFLINGADAKIFGSQGQQRSISLCMKLAVTEYIKKSKKISPMLVLDDVFSELDENRRAFLLSCIKDIQTVITATDFDNTKIAPDKVFYIEEGCICE